MEQRLAVLADTLNLISSSLDLDETLQRITESATKALNAKAGAVCLVDRDENTLYFKTIYGGGGERLRKVTLKVGEGVIGWVTRENRPALIPDAREDPRYKFDLEEKTGLSARREGPLVPINCTALPETLLESELFGHEKGAFTGAVTTRKGKFELADRGTLFLDEIGDMSLGIQAKILRAIETKTFCPVGSEKELNVDVRIIVATNKNLLEECNNKRFREDLFYRLNEFQINLPPLRERREDIPLLTETFIKEFSARFKKEIKGIDKGAMDLLLNYSWPGNVRQLKSAIKHAIIMADGDTITQKELSMDVMAEPSVKPQAISDRLTTLDDIEKDHILFVLKQTSWNKAKASKILGISRPTLDTKISKHGLVSS